MSLLAVLTVIACSITAAVVPSAAHAYKVEGKRWPGKTITVRNLSPFTFAVPEAMRRWNAVGMPITFKASKSKRANLTIRSQRPKGNGIGGEFGCAGLATVGYSRFGPARMDLLESCDDDLLTASVIVHELGHVLGLGHERKQCAIMNPTSESGSGEHCGVESVFLSGIFRCRVIEPDDIAGIRKLYRGAPKVPGTLNCPAFGPPAAATSITAAYVPGQVPQLAQVTLPVAPTSLLRINDLKAPQPELLVAAAPDACVAVAPASAPADADRWWTNWGESTSVPIGTAFTPGRWCISVWVKNALGTSAPATTWLDVPPPPPDPYAGF